VDPLVCAEALVKAYRQEADRQQLLVKKARITENQLLFIGSAVKKLFRDENFLTQLRAEGLETLPEYLAQRIQSDKSDGETGSDGLRPERRASFHKFQEQCSTLHSNANRRPDPSA
jgi:hypothetical protein